jgi:hypothetical protein
VLGDGSLLLRGEGDSLSLLEGGDIGDGSLFLDPCLASSLLKISDKGKLLEV